jgi:hypothetical protein
MLAPQNALVGLFLDDSVPTSSGAPGRLDFSTSGVGMSFPTLSPGLKQPFFIGDGMTGTGTGAVQQFVVPAGATRFFLGVVDGVEWHNNTGALNVTVTFSGGGASAGPLAAALLPTSRSVQVGNSGVVFATILNAGGAAGQNCGIVPTTSVPANFSFQTTDPTTNALTGSPNAGASIPPGGGQTYVIALTPTAPFPPTDVTFSFKCSNSDAAHVATGLNTLLLSGSVGAVPDIIALAATINRNGIVDVVGGSGVFSVASFNLGAGGPITVTADTGTTVLPIAVFVCQTDPRGLCLQPPAASVTTQIDTNATPTFGVFIAGQGAVPFDPAANRIFVRFKDAGGATRGATSVAVRTQ